MGKRNTGLVGGVGRLIATLALGAAAALGVATHAQADTTFLNVSYDPTRELYQDFNQAFGKEWKAKTGETVNFKQSHGGSGAQARSVLDGLQADVVTLALAYDIDALANKGRQQGLAEAPARQRVAVHVDDRVPGAQGQSEGDQGLGRPDQAGHLDRHAESEDVGGARWNYLPHGRMRCTSRAATSRRRRNSSRSSTRTQACSIRRARRDHELRAARDRRRADRMGKRGIPVGQGVRHRQVRDRRAVGEHPTEPPVAVVDKVVDKKGTRKLADAYLNFLYSPQGQEIAARNYYRPRSKNVPAELTKQFPKLKLYTVDDTFGGWTNAQKTHFADGGVFDSIYKPQ